MRSCSRGAGTRTHEGLGGWGEEKRLLGGVGEEEEGMKLYREGLLGLGLGWGGGVWGGGGETLSEGLSWGDGVGGRAAHLKVSLCLSCSG